MTRQIVTFGEPLIRLSAPRGRILSDSNAFDVFVGGSELNVAIAASSLGNSSTYVTKIPANDLGQMVIKVARKYRVDVSHVLIAENGRMGLYFHEFGSSQRPARVLYDRRGTAFGNISPDELNWASILTDASVFHTSGITAALGEGPLSTLKSGIKEARAHNLAVSFDVNYRSTLWSEESARHTINSLLPDIDILFASLNEMRLILGDNSLAIDEAMKRIADTSGIPIIAGVSNEKQSPESPWVACAYWHGELIVEQRPFRIDTVDRIGAGDAFIAGFLNGFLNNDPLMGLQYGSAMMALKNAFLGDFCPVTIADVDRFISDSGSTVNR